MNHQKATAAARAESTYTLRSGRRPGAIDRVELLLEVGGHVKQVVDDKVQSMKTNIVCKLGYDENTLEVSGGLWRAARYYDEVSAVVKVEETGLKPVLRPGRRLIAVEVDAATVTLFSPHGALTRDELDLVDIPADSLVLDRLLPKGPVAVGDSWKLSEKLLAALLGLDAISKADVQSELTDITNKAASMRMTGRVEGALGGVSTEIELKAKYRFNRKTGRIDWLGLLVKEQRSIGHVYRGVDVVSRLQMTVTPKTVSTELDAAALKGLASKPTAALNQLTYESPQHGWQFTHDRCWHVIADHRDLAILRMLDRGDLVAQCNVSSLPKLPPGKEVTLSEFQSDVQKALDKSFGSFVEARQWAGETGYRIYRVAVRGTASELPIQWNYYLITDQQGRRVALAFTVEGELVEQLDKADETLIGSLRFLDPKVAPTPKRPEVGGKTGKTPKG